MRLREPTERDPPVRIRALLPENISNSSPDVEEELGDIRGRWRAVRARTPAVFNLSFDEELVVKSTTSRTRVEWLAAGHRYLQITTPRPVLQVGWGRFGDDEEAFAACILMPGLLDIHGSDSTNYSVPLLFDFDGFFPLPRGILLTNSSNENSSYVLFNPLDELTPLVASLQPWDPKSEVVVWTSIDVPLMATYNNENSHLSIWKLETFQQNSQDLMSLKSLPQSYTDKLSKSEATGTPRSLLRRPLRLPDGSLSPQTFQATKPSEPHPARGPYTPEDSTYRIDLIYRELWEHGMPTQGHVVLDDDGRMVLAFLSQATGVLKGIVFNSHSVPLGCAFEAFDVKSAAAVSVLRSKIGCMSLGHGELSSQNCKEDLDLYFQKQDLLLLKSDGSLLLYSGHPHLTSVELVLACDETTYFDLIQTEKSKTSPGLDDFIMKQNKESNAEDSYWDRCNYIEKGAIANISHPAGSRISLTFRNGAKYRISLDTVLPLCTAIREALPYSSGSTSPSSVWSAWCTVMPSFFSDKRYIEFYMLRALVSSKKFQLKALNGDMATDSHWDTVHAISYEQSYCRTNNFEWLEHKERYDAPDLASEGLKQVRACISLNVLNKPSIEDLDNFLINTNADEAEIGTKMTNILLGAQDSSKYRDENFLMLAKCFHVIRENFLLQQLHDNSSNVMKTSFAKTCGLILQSIINAGRNLSAIDLLPLHFASLLEYFISKAPIVCGEILQPYLEPVLTKTKLNNRVSGSHIFNRKDGMQHIEKVAISLRFGDDSRLAEVRRLLDSSSPAVMKGGETAEDGTEGVRHQEADLHVLASRTMALPFGRGAFVFKTHRCLPTEALYVPCLCLSARIVERNNAVINLDLSTAPPAPAGGAMAELTAWPEFHNGVAAGLRLAPGARLTRTWIAYNSPSEPSFAHAGMLLALGLTGQLSCLAVTDLYRHLSQEHDPTVIGILLGMSSAKRSSMDSAISKMLFLHLPTSHPATYPELELSPLVQTAAVLGLGMLYQGSKHRGIIDILVQEIGRRPGNATSYPDKRLPQQGVTQDCEGYALAAGFALGLVTLGKGRSVLAEGDSRIEDQLRYYLLGGWESGLATEAGFLSAVGASGISIDETLGGGHINLYGEGPSFQQTSLRDANRTSGAVAEELLAAQAAAQLILEGKLLNLHVTSPAAAVALGLMYLKTNGERCASLFKIPSSRYELARIHPQQLCIFCIMKNMVCWDAIRATKDWVINLLPEIVKDPFSMVVLEEDDGIAILQAHIHLIIGACISIGIRYAATANETAAGTLRHFAIYFLKAKRNLSSSRSHSISKSELEDGLANIVLALSIVMAGTGDLKTMSLIRSLLRRVGNTREGHCSIGFGSYMAISQALGFLFLGAGSFQFGTDMESIAALLIATYPRLPQNSNDNRYHLQALRHFWVLAAKPLKNEGIQRNGNISKSYVQRYQDYVIRKESQSSLEGEATIVQDFVDLIEGLLGDSLSLCQS